MEKVAPHSTGQLKADMGILVVLLLEYRASVKARATNGMTPLGIALEQLRFGWDNHQTVVDILREHGAVE